MGDDLRASREGKVRLQAFVLGSCPYGKTDARGAGGVEARRALIGQAPPSARREAGRERARGPVTLAPYSGRGLGTLAVGGD